MDKTSFSHEDEENKVMQRFSAFNRDKMVNFEKMINTPLTGGNSRARFSKKYTKDDVLSALENPSGNVPKLREISRNLYYSSSHYKRLVDYMAYLPTYSYLLEPIRIAEDYDKEKLLKEYNECMNMIDNMNIKHEFIKVLKTGFREDVFYGYTFETENSFFIKKLDPNWCEISSYEDGVFNFAFNFKFFDGKEDLLESYPSEFKSKYRKYKRENTEWIELNSENTICIKVNEDFEFPLPPFAGTFESLYDIEAYKRLRKSKEELSNFKVLVSEVPLRTDSDLNNDFAVDFETIALFHNKASKALPPNVGLISTPFKTEEFNFERKNADSDNVSKAERDFWSSSGVSQLLFNTDKSTSSGLEKSIRTDEEIIFGVLRQLERWLNRRIKKKFKNFRIHLLNITAFNKKEVFESALKSAQFGFPVRNLIGATLDLNPSSVNNLITLEQDLLGLHDRMIPLSSSHTVTENDGEGRPQEDDVGDEGERTREGDKNDEYK